MGRELTCGHFLLLLAHFREILGRLSQILGHFFQNVLNPVLREILQVKLSDLSAQRIQFTAIMWSWPGTDRGADAVFPGGTEKTRRDDGF